ncbi:MAG TPA: hypothetical protein VJZ00_07080, partial [Thermoanaerobaculia bacterium]|nr:hypothetical protein [Thermoanaerobaculia bacterium]
ALAIAALAVAGWDRVRLDRRWLDLLVVLVIVADLLPRARPLLATAPFQRHPVPYARAIGTGAKFLHFGETDLAHREAWISGYLNLYDRRFDAFTPAPLIDERYLRDYRELLAKPTHVALATRGIGFTLTKLALVRPFVPIARSGNVIVYEGYYAAPMAAHLWRAPSMMMRPARWSVDTSHARVTIDAPHDGILVLRQQAAPGWRVTIDGAPAPPLIVDGVFRGVQLARGRHEVVWTYRPMPFFIGGAMTLITLVAMQLSLFVKRSRAR